MGRQLVLHPVGMRPAWRDHQHAVNATLHIQPGRIADRDHRFAGAGLIDQREQLPTVWRLRHAFERLALVREGRDFEREGLFGCLHRVTEYATPLDRL